MISRSEQGPRCPHCTRINPAIVLRDAPLATLDMAKCIHCGGGFRFWIENLPFYCTEDGRSPRCECDVCTGKVTPSEEAPPNG